MTSTFDTTFQSQILTHALRDTMFMQRIDGLLEPKYFDADTHGWLVDLANRHFNVYRVTPDSRIIVKEIKDSLAAKRIKREFVDDLKPVLASVFSPAADLSNRDFYVEEVSKFARQRAMEAALTEAIDILDVGGDFEEIEAKIRAAQAVGALDGTASRDFFDTVNDRINARIAKMAGTIMGGITTGHRELNELLYHKGWGKKELYILMGGAKAGKSTGLAWFALKAVEAGFKVLYTTHENSAEVTLARMDAAMANVLLKDVETSGPSIQAAAAALGARGGLMKVEEYPAGEATVADLARLVGRYKAKGIKFDMLVCDYADEMRASVHFEEERFKLKSVYTSLRALGTTEDLAILTATQTNRAGNKAVTAVATDVGEDWSKMKIADGVITLNSTPEERKLNQMRLHFALMRNNEQGITVHCVVDRAKMRFINRIAKVA